jgi:hypothetical protein
MSAGTPELAEHSVASEFLKHREDAVLNTTACHATVFWSLTSSLPTNVLSPRKPLPSSAGSSHSLQGSAMPNDALLNRIRAEYLEMPGLRLTLEQAQRLCGVERTACKAVLEELVDAEFLCMKANGAYARLSDGEVRSQQTVQTDAGVETSARSGRRRLTQTARDA